MLSPEEGNKLISDYIEKGEPFAVCRVGIGGETLSTYYMDINRSIDNNVNRMLRVNAGMYGDCLNEFYREFVDGISCADMQVVWDHNLINEAQNHLFSKYSPSSHKLSSRSVEPFYFVNPWSEKLKDKKVLVIYPFSESIKSQYNERDKIFDNDKILPEFELITYKPVQSIGGEGPHSSWKESLDIMKNDISNIDFDIALLGCGSYGLPLVNFIKNEMNKSAIYIGGGLQILFGIKGSRWENHNIISNLYNEYWVYPLESETPQKYKMVEGGCYWK